MNQNQPVQPHIRRMLHQKAFVRRIPINGAFELTPCCNLNCKMCYIRMSEAELQERGTLRSAEEWIALGRECVEAGMLFLLITGGEPMMHREFREIYTKLHEMGLIITLNTNGTMLTEEYVNWLKQHPPAKVNITLYGSSNETYARLCGHPTGYDAALRGLKLLMDAGIYVNINSSFTPENIADMEDIFEVARCHDLPITGACYMFPPVRSAKEGVFAEEHVRFTPEEAGRARAHAERLKLDQDVIEKMAEQIKKGVFEPVADTEDCVRTRDSHMNCVAAKSSFWVTWKGEMTPCGMMNAPVVHPFENGFLKEWKKLGQLTDVICLPDACGSCEMRDACMICGALSMAEGHGDSTIKPEYLCQMTEAYLKEFKTFGKKPPDV